MSHPHPQCFSHGTSSPSSVSGLIVYLSLFSCQSVYSWTQPRSGPLGAPGPLWRKDAVRRMGLFHVRQTSPVGQRGSPGHKTQPSVGVGTTEARWTSHARSSEFRPEQFVGAAPGAGGRLREHTGRELGGQVEHASEASLANLGSRDSVSPQSRRERAATQSHTQKISEGPMGSGDDRWGLHQTVMLRILVCRYEGNLASRPPSLSAYGPLPAQCPERSC